MNRKGKIDIMQAVKDQNVGDFVQNRENRQNQRQLDQINNPNQGRRLDSTLILPEINLKKNPDLIKHQGDIFGDYIDVNHCILAMNDYWSDDSDDLAEIKPMVKPEPSKG